MSQIVGSNNKVYRLVLTGGPSGGKTTGQARLSTFFESLGWRVFRVPQMLSALTGGGLRASDVDMSEETWYRLNANLLRLLIQVETTYFEMASTSAGSCLVICDGGTMDIKAHLICPCTSHMYARIVRRTHSSVVWECIMGSSTFISSAAEAAGFVNRKHTGLTDEQWTRLMQETGCNDVELRDSRYNQVVRMVSLASSKGKDNNELDLFSMHCAVDAKKQDEIVSQAWVGHPYYDVVDNSTDFDKKIRRMISAVCYRLNIQVGDRLAVDSHKRKFLVSKVPVAELFPQFQDFTVVHDYLATPNHKMQARIRRRGQNADADISTPVTPVGCIQLDVNQEDSPPVFIVGTDADLNNWTYTHTIRCSQSEAQNSDDPELKMQISPREYELLLGQKDTERLTVFKTRRCFLWNNQYFQLDIYKEPWPPGCHGLIMLETYTAVKGSEFELPSFLDVLREVTGNPAYSMYNLSKKLTSSDTSIRSIGGHELFASDRLMNGDVSSPMEVRNGQPVDTTQHENCDAIVEPSSEVVKMRDNRAEVCPEKNEEVILKPCLKKVLKARENNMVNLICDRVKPNDLINTRSFDKLSKWRDAKRNPGSESFTNVLL